MAIDPQVLSQEQMQREAINNAGSPTDFAGNPADGVEVVKSGSLIKMLEVLNRFDPSPNIPLKPALPSGEATDPNMKPNLGPQPGRMPTPQEINRVPDPGAFSEAATKNILADRVLSPQGAAQFRADGLKAEQPPEQQSIVSAQEALEMEAAQPALDINNLADKALTAETRGFKPETALVSDDIADQILARQNAKQQNIVSLQEGGDFNFDYVDSSDDVKSMITATAEVFKDEQTLRKRARIPNEITLNNARGIMADEIGMTRKILDRRIGEGAMTAEEFVAGRTILVKSAARLADLAKKIKDGSADAGDRLKFRRQLAVHTGIQLQLKGAQTEAARALQSFQIKVDGELNPDGFNAEAQRILSESGSGDITDSMASALLDVAENSGLEGVNKFAQKGVYAKGKEMLHEAYLAGLLTSPATQFRNILGSAIHMAYQLPAEMIAGMYGSAFRTVDGMMGQRVAGKEMSADQVYMEDALLRVIGWKDSFSDAWQIAKTAYKNELPVSESSKLDVDVYTAISGESDSFLAQGISRLGKTVRIPFRLLLGADEFFKTISQRGEMYTAAHRDFQHALRQGKSITEAQDMAGRRLLDPRSIAAELDHKAKFDTLQSDLGKFGEVSSMFQRTLVGRFILPFATAPTNSMLRTLEYLPWGALKPSVFKDLAQGPGTRAHQMAMGRLALGGGTMAVVQSYAHNGQITGGMPADRQLREALPEGWQPYSIVLRGDNWPQDADGNDLPLYDNFGNPNGNLNFVSYAGFEPIGAVLGISADITQRMNLAMSPEERQTFAGAAITATAAYYKELPMLQGMSEVLDMLKGIADGKFNGKNAAYIAKSYAENSTIAGLPNPWAALNRMAFRLDDPTLVDPRDELQYITLEDVETLVDDGNGNLMYQYGKGDGSINYNAVGMVKDSDATEQLLGFFNAVNSYQAKDSFLRDERDYNAIRYDTFGRPFGAKDFSLANKPGLALFNNLTGVRIRESEEPEQWEKDLVTLAKIEGSWPLSNPDSFAGIRLSKGFQSDLVNNAKNRMILNGATFREALSDFILSDDYVGMENDERMAEIRSLQKDYFNEAFLEEIEDPKNANLKAVYEYRQENADNKGNN